MLEFTLLLGGTRKSIITILLVKFLGLVIMGLSWHQSWKRGSQKVQSIAPNFISLLRKDQMWKSETADRVQFFRVGTGL